MIKKFFQDPLSQFLLIGAALFVVYAIMNPASPGDSDRKIVVSAGRIEQLASIFAKTWQRPPTPEELKGLIDDYVIEEVYYRKAVTMGIDKNDTMIRRRMRQKMEFLSDDAAALAEPGDEELKSYLAANESKFRVEPVYTFRQIFFNPEKHPGDPQAYVQARAEVLHTGGEVEGDQTLLPVSFEEVSARTVDSTFGTGFAKKLDDLTLGQWSGPVASGIGLHLVRLESRQPGRLPDLQQIRPLVQREWANQKRLDLRQKFNAELLKDYKVVIEWPKPQK
jgi:PPIC-type PPIASE domain